MQRTSGWFERADTAVDLKRYDLALQLVIDGLAISPDDARLLALGARIQFLRKAYREACDFGRQAIGKNPDYSDGYYWLAHSMLRMPAADRNREEMQTAAKRYMEIHPQHHTAHQLAGRLAWDEFDDRAEAEKCYRRALELDPTNDNTLYSLGRVTRQLGRLGESEEFLHKLRELHPNYGWCMRELAWLHLRKKEPKEALQYGFAARELLLTDTETFNAIAEAALELKDYDLALQSVRDSLAVEPKDCYVLTLAAKIQVKRGKYFQACEFAREAIPLDPKYWDAHFWLAIALGYSPTDSRDPAELRRAVEKTLELGPKSHSSHQAAAKMYWDLQERDKAEEHLQRALSLKEDDDWTLTHLGRKAHQERRYNDSRKYLEKALQLNPNSADGNLEMAQLLVLQSREPEAVPYALAARRLLADDSETKTLITKLIPFLHPRTHTLFNATQELTRYFPPVLAVLLLVFQQFVNVPPATLIGMWLIGSATVPWFSATLLTAVQFNLPELQQYQTVTPRQQFRAKLMPLLPTGLLIGAAVLFWLQAWPVLTLLSLFSAIVLLRSFRRGK